jgi:hypothetical protein
VEAVSPIQQAVAAADSTVAPSLNTLGPSPGGCDFGEANLPCDHSRSGGGLITIVHQICSWLLRFHSVILSAVCDTARAPLAPIRLSAARRPRPTGGLNRFLPVRQRSEPSS